MTFKSITNGARLTARRPGLTLLIYLVNLFVALIISIPIYGALSAATATTGFGPELVERFDLVLWADILQKAGDVLAGSFAQLIWTIPLYLFWKVVMSVGLVYALRDGGIRSFWQGVGHYAGRATLLALLFLLALIAWIFVLAVIVVIASLVFTHTEATFTLYWIVVPSAIVISLALLDLMHDYGRINLVSLHSGAVAAWIEGMKFPLRHPSALFIYVFWAMLSVVLSVAAVRLNASLGTAMAGVWLLFLGQQVVFLLRAGITVAWFGSEVSLFESIRLREPPLIAGVTPDTGGLNVQPA